eukprot:gene6158-2769_t
MQRIFCPRGERTERRGKQGEGEKEKAKESAKEKVEEEKKEGTGEKAVLVEERGTDKAEAGGGEGGQKGEHEVLESVAEQ